jgi:hypothetical protein
LKLNHKTETAGRQPALGVEVLALASYPQGGEDDRRTCVCLFRGNATRAALAKLVKRAYRELQRKG